MDVQTTHRIVPFGRDKMLLFDCQTGATVVTAQLSAGLWTISVDPDTATLDDVTADTQPTAIDSMISQALAALPGAGYSTLVPYELRQVSAE